MACTCGKHRTTQGCAGAKTIATFSPEQLSKNGHRGKPRLRIAEKCRELEARIAALERNFMGPV
jgi:hypothetical protein